MADILLFDLDGTLVDTEQVATEVTDLYFRRHGHQVPAQDLEILLGTAWPAAMAFLLERHPIAKPLDAVVEEALVDYRLALSKGIPEIPGSRAAIAALAPHFRLGVVSGSHRHDIAAALETLGVSGYFEHIVGFEDYPESKPSPAPYLEMLRRFAGARSRVLVFEDSENGVRSAQAAGLSVVAVGNEPHLTKSRPSTPWVIPNLSDVTVEWVTDKLATLTAHHR